MIVKWKLITDLGRYLITAGLLYGVYTETGIFTATALACIFVGGEIFGYCLNRLLKAVRDDDALADNEVLVKYRGIGTTKEAWITDHPPPEDIPVLVTQELSNGKRIVRIDRLVKQQPRFDSLPWGSRFKNCGHVIAWKPIASSEETYDAETVETEGEE